LHALQSAKGFDEHQGDVGAKTNFASGYGGKFGVQNVKDASAKGWDESQGDVGAKTNFSSGYGGKYGVSTTKDASAKGWDESQGDVGAKTNFAAGYGGKYGVQDVKDKVSAVSHLNTCCDGVFGCTDAHRTHAHTHAFTIVSRSHSHQWHVEGVRSGWSVRTSAEPVYCCCLCRL